MTMCSHVFHVTILNLTCQIHITELQMLRKIGVQLNLYKTNISDTLKKRKKHLSLVKDQIGDM